MIHIKKIVVFLLFLTALLSFCGIAYAVGDIAPTPYDLSQPRNGYEAKDWNYKEQGENVSSGGYTGSTGLSTSVHIYGTWNSPYTLGIDGFNYNDSQDYTDDGTMTSTGLYTAGPHGGYLTTSHKCRECHAVHRAAGKFKLLRSDTRFEACDWCHGTGAGSGFNIEMDNDDAFTTEYNTGHTMGFGISSGKWKAPDDTYPAFTPNYWFGGFSCFDCHSPHANPQRILGYNNSGQPVGTASGGKTYGISNPGHDILPNDTTHLGNDPVYLSGSWLLIKDPDHELASSAESNISYYDVNQGSVVSTSVTEGQEISDGIFAFSAIINGEATITSGQLHQFSADTAYPINKLPIDWNVPIGGANDASSPGSGFYTRNTTDNMWSVSEFCTDCHDGNSSLHTTEAPVFSEDRALRAAENNSVAPDWKNSYDLAYGHDEQSRQQCKRQLRFNPEDGEDFGPNCRNCHRGSSGCRTCHQEPLANYTISPPIYTADSATAANDALGLSTYSVFLTSTGENNMVVESPTYKFYKKSRTVDWSNAWRTASGFVAAGQRMAAGQENATGVGSACADDGFSWPHRTLGFKMLKDDLFGLDFNGQPVAVGGSRHDGANTYAVHDIDSVCLDCHNPAIWNASSMTTHTDTASNPYNDDLLLRGLP
ncbi:MAG: hypothetical protein ACYC56_09770 [Candidatus Aquicultor sp.]